MHKVGTRHVLHHETVKAVLRRHETRSYRAMAADLGFPERYAITLSMVARNRTGCLTAQGEEVLRLALGLPSIKDKRRCLHASPELFARLQVMRGDLPHEQFLTLLCDMWDQVGREINAISIQYGADDHTYPGGSSASNGDLDCDDSGIESKKEEVA